MKMVVKKLQTGHQVVQIKGKNHYLLYGSCRDLWTGWRMLLGEPGAQRSAFKLANA